MDKSIACLPADRTREMVVLHAEDYPKKLLQAVQKDPQFSPKNVKAFPLQRAAKCNKLVHELCKVIGADPKIEKALSQ